LNQEVNIQFKSRVQYTLNINNEERYNMAWTKQLQTVNNGSLEKILNREKCHVVVYCFENKKCQVENVTMNFD